MQWVDDAIVSHADPKQFGGLSGTSTTDALVEMTHKWYESIDSLNVYVCVVLLDFSKAFDLINHNILLNKLRTYGITDHIKLLRWLAEFLLDRTQQMKIENEYSEIARPNVGGGVQGTICGPKCFIVFINDPMTPVPLYKYVDDSTLFEICEMKCVSLMQQLMDIAARWTSNNDMKINPEKSKEMIICFAPKK